MYVLLIVVCTFVLFLLAIVFSVLLRFTNSDCHFDIFKLFLLNMTTGPWISQQGLGYHNRALDITTGPGYHNRALDITTRPGYHNRALDITTGPWISQHGLDITTRPGYHNRALDITTGPWISQQGLEYHNRKIWGIET